MWLYLRNHRSKQIVIVKKKWCIIFAYRLPNTDKEEFFDEISVSPNKILSKYDNIILASDLSIDELRLSSDLSRKILLCPSRTDVKDTFSQRNLIKETTCFKSQNSTLLDLILTNRPRSFYEISKL